MLMYTRLSERAHHFQNSFHHLLFFFLILYLYILQERIRRFFRKAWEMVPCAALLPLSTTQICCPRITLVIHAAGPWCCRARDPGWESILLCTGCIDLKMLESGWWWWGTVSRTRWTVGCSLTRGFTSVYLGLGLNPDSLHTTVFVSGMCHRPLSSRKSQSSRRTEHVRSDAVTDKRDTRKANQRKVLGKETVQS